MKKKAVIYRMVTPDHLCPWGIKGKDLLKRHGYEVEDHHLSTMDEDKQFKEKHHVDETPQVWIEDKYIGNYDELREHLGLGPDPKEGTTYQPVIAIFAVTLGMALTTSWVSLGALDPIRVIELFIAFTMCALGIQKIQDLQSYTNGFVQYDLLAQRYVPYAWVYAYIETVGGVLMIAGLITWIIAPIVLFATTIGAVSIIKAVFVEKRSLKCACVGGDSNVPLGFISLSENLGMMAMALWMMIKAL
jgi:glutaredoxin/uncharacterized membrane protein YphA (DoxX/SURF4 family)